MNQDAVYVQAVRTELAEWFGAAAVSQYQLLRIYRIPFCRSDVRPPTNLQQRPALGSGLYVCGDHRATTTLEGAFSSGRSAAAALLADAP
jgi:predicted NAD/FAD-dependent oxidoreductase